MRLNTLSLFALVLALPLVIGASSLTDSILYVPSVNITGGNLSLLGDFDQTGGFTIREVTNDTTALQIRADQTERGAKMVWWDDPTSTNNCARIGQFTAHGNATGSLKNEMAWYVADEACTMQNRFKLLSNNDSQSELILTGAAGITRSSGLTFTMGASVLGGGTAKVNFKDDIIMENAQPISFKDTGATQRDALVLDTSNDLYLKNEVTSANTGYIFLQNRNSSSSLVTKLRVNYANIGSEDDVRINDVLMLNPRAVAPTSPALGQLYVDSSTNELCFYNSTAWVGLQGRTCA